MTNSAANTGGATPSTLESPEGNVIMAFKTFFIFSLGSVSFSKEGGNLRGGGGGGGGGERTASKPPGESRLAMRN